MESVVERYGSGIAPRLSGARGSMRRVLAVAETAHRWGPQHEFTHAFVAGWRPESRWPRIGVRTGICGPQPLCHRQRHDSRGEGRISRSASFGGQCFGLPTYGRDQPSRSPQRNMAAHVLDGRGELPRVAPQSPVPRISSGNSQRIETGAGRDSYKTLRTREFIA
jgi:hypothetical protein